MDFLPPNKKSAQSERCAACRCVVAGVAVVSFHDIPATRLIELPLPTVALFPRRLGQRAAELLFDNVWQTGIALRAGAARSTPASSSPVKSR